jgi:hypothetical protein
MNFLHLHLFHKEVEFGNIVGYDNIKDIIRRALSSNENYNLLFCGPPASVKTLPTWNIGMQARRLLRWLKYH